MKLKALFLSSAILTVAALFTYCTKETPAAEPVQTVNTEQEEAGSRALCQVNIQAIGGCLDVCGTQTTPAICGSVGGVPLTGSAFIPMGGNQNFFINSPAKLLISRNPSCVSSQFVGAIVTSNGAKPYVVPLVGTVEVTIDNLCTPN